MKYFIGIDPGKSGAIAVLQEKKEPVVFDMPLMPNGSVDAMRIFEEMPMNSPENEVYCMIEKAQSMSKQGVKGIFTYGKGYGAIIAALQIAGVPFFEVTPTKWKNHFSLNKDKKRSATVCLNLFPGAEIYTPRRRLLDGRAEALLLAEYARIMRST